jgi:DNA-binding transcriptional regulator YiaG
MTRNRKHNPLTRQNEEHFGTYISQWLRTLRKRLALTQTELGYLISASIESVSRWELGMTQPNAYNMAQLMALATEQEREALVDKASDYLDDGMSITFGGHGTPEAVAKCDACGADLRVRDFTTRGWPAPPLVQQDGNPYQIRRCPLCQSKRGS